MSLEIGLMNSIPGSPSSLRTPLLPQVGKEHAPSSAGTNGSEQAASISPTPASTPPAAVYMPGRAPSNAGAYFRPVQIVPQEAQASAQASQPSVPAPPATEETLAT